MTACVGQRVREVKESMWLIFSSKFDRCLQAIGVTPVWDSPGLSGQASDRLRVFSPVDCSRVCAL